MEKHLRLIFNRRVETQKAFADIISLMDPKARGTLVFGINALKEINYPAKLIADKVGVHRATISRWQNDQNIPHSPAFRAFAIGIMLEELKNAPTPKSDLLKNDIIRPISP